jgi:hypothetical protein
LSAGGDLATGGVVTQAQSGAISFSSTGQVACSTGMTNCQFKQATKASDTATNAMSIQAQSAFASATVNPNGATLTLAGGASAGGAITTTGGGVVLQGGTSAATVSGTPGSVTALFGAPTGTGSEGQFVVSRAGSPILSMGPYQGGGGSTYSGLYLGNAAATAGQLNYSLLVDNPNTSLLLNVPTSSGTIQFRSASSNTLGKWDATQAALLTAPGYGLQIGALTTAFGGATGGVLGLTNGSAAPTAGVSTGSIIQSYGNNLSMWAPAATNAAGSVVLNLGPTGTGTEPALEITNGGSPVMWLQRQGAGTGAIYLYGGATPTANNMSILAGSGYTYLNATSNVGQLLGNATFLTYGGSGYYNLFSSTGSAYGGSNTLNLNAGTEITSAPAIGMASLVSDSAGLHVNTTNAASSTTLVNTVVAPVLQGAATGQQDKILKFLANVQTTSTAAVTALTIPLATSGTNGDFVVHAVGRLHSGATSFAQTYECLIENSAGTLAAATTTGISIAKSYDTAYSGAAVTCTVSGTNVLVNVAGILATTIDWTVAADVLVN